MKILNEMKLRFVMRAICKAAKHLGIELERLIEILQEEWERA